MKWGGVDIGGSTRVGICIIDDDENILYSTNIPKSNKTSPSQHRRAVASAVLELVIKYEVEAIGVERVKMHRGSRLSKLSSIVSLAKATGTLLDTIDVNCKVYDFETISWKAKILGNKAASKEDAVNFIQLHYGISVPHDEADAICQALYLKRYLNKPEGHFSEITLK